MVSYFFLLQEFNQAMQTFVSTLADILVRHVVKLTHHMQRAFKAASKYYVISDVFKHKQSSCGGTHKMCLCVCACISKLADILVRHVVKLTHHMQRAFKAASKYYVISDVFKHKQSSCGGTHKMCLCVCACTSKLANILVRYVVKLTHHM